MSLKRRFIFVLLVNEEHARILTRPLYDIKNASRLAAGLFLKFVEEFNHFFFMPGFNRNMHCQNQHFTSALGAAFYARSLRAPFSRSSRYCLRHRPPPYPPSLPSLLTTRWQGIKIAMRFNPFA